MDMDGEKRFKMLILGVLSDRLSDQKQSLIPV